ncbi:MAG: type II secretion system minor pseudopilin GspK [Rhodoferax sp.]|nr:type II secretion system minor pseudopilin GspK [Rhodoferax sp.]
MKHAKHRGAALLTAMLTVTLVATFASAALWQQWRGVEIEAAERSRTQMQWVLNGALDWSRLILQEDARGKTDVDHLSEPWALPLQEARLSSFLAMDKDHTDDAMDAFLSGQISDQQALLNVRNLVQDGKPAATATKAFERLFILLNLPRAQLQLVIDGLVASDAATATVNAPAADAKPAEAQGEAPLKPYRLEQLVWLGLPRATVQALAPYAVLLPVATPVNVNTASVEVLRAAVPDFDMARAQQLVAQRATTHFESVTEALRAAGVNSTSLPTDALNGLSVRTQYFAVRGRLRLGESTVQEVSLVERNGGSTKVIWRQRENPAAPALASLQ